ncbi:MAG: hypothetical protein A2Y16_05480 [Tenericutes bacterium GWF2_57_13]|nr:MAG: hypothetical protein A2Y16_05480 [Tenericutes bacterium GWF2_57_13]
MAKSNVHVVPHGKEWAVERANAQRPSNVFDTKKEAMERAREIAKNAQVELIPHNKDGQISNPNTFAPKDPNPPKDKKH